MTIYNSCKKNAEVFNMSTVPSTDMPLDDAAVKRLLREARYTPPSIETLLHLTMAFLIAERLDAHGSHSVTYLLLDIQNTDTDQTTKSLAAALYLRLERLHSRSFDSYYGCTTEFIEGVRAIALSHIVREMQILLRVSDDTTRMVYIEYATKKLKPHLEVAVNDIRARLLVKDLIYDLHNELDDISQVKYTLFQLMARIEALEQKRFDHCVV